MANNLPINLPKKVGGSKPGLLRPEAWNAMVDTLAQLLARTRANTPHPGADIGIRPTDAGFVPFLKRRGSRGHKPSRTPYWPTLITTPGDTPTYEVTVGWGYVCERIPGAGDAIAYHEAANMWDTEDPSALRKFPITVGQAVYIRTEVDEDGKIGISEGDAVTIVIAADEESSTHYIPKVDDGTSSGAAGHYLYKLAVLAAPVSPSTAPTIEKWLTGSHIDHYQELPAMLSATAVGTGIGVIPKEWSDSEKAYKFRAISQKDPVTADPEADPPVRGEAVQINVEQEENRIIVKGNGKGRVIKYQIEGESEAVVVATFDDGLETEGSEAGNEITIPIPAAGGGLPDGNVGDMLYHNGETWVLLEAPGAPESNEEWVMHHDATAPGWFLYNKITVDICVSGTPTEYTILGIPTPPPP
jgi:hypothetical protein